MDSEKSIDDFLREILKNIGNFQVKVDQIKPDDKLYNIGLDSIKRVKLIVEIENQFDFEFEVEDLISNNLDTLEQINFYIQQKIMDCTISDETNS